VRWQTSKPLSFGIITSRNTRFGFTASIVASASSPLDAGQELDTLVLELLERLVNERSECGSSSTIKIVGVGTDTPYW
jgi:hypothetical protein